MEGMEGWGGRSIDRAGWLPRLFTILRVYGSRSSADQTVPIFSKCNSSQTDVMYMPQSSLCKVQPHDVVVLTLVQATDGEMEVLQKLFHYFLLDKFCHSVKTPKREMNRVESGKASKTRRRWAGLEEQSQPLTQRSPPGLDQVFVSEKGVGMLIYYLYMWCFLINTLQGLAF